MCVAIVSVEGEFPTALFTAIERALDRLHKALSAIAPFAEGGDGILNHRCEVAAELVEVLDDPATEGGTVIELHGGGRERREHRVFDAFDCLPAAVLTVVEGGAKLCTGGLDRLGVPLGAELLHASESAPEMGLVLVGSVAVSGDGRIRFEDIIDDGECIEYSSHEVEEGPTDRRCWLDSRHDRPLPPPLSAPADRCCTAHWSTRPSYAALAA